MSEIKGFSNKLHEPNSRQQSQVKPNKKNDFNQELIQNLENLKSIEDKIDSLTENDQKTANSLDIGVKNAGVILKDMEGVLENFKDKGSKST